MLLHASKQQRTTLQKNQAGGKSDWFSSCFCISSLLRTHPLPGGTPLCRRRNLLQRKRETDGHPSLLGFLTEAIQVPRRGNMSSTPWEYEFHAVGMRVPRRGNASSTPWGIRVPRRGEYEFHAVGTLISPRGVYVLLLKFLAADGSPFMTNCYLCPANNYRISQEVISVENLKVEFGVTPLFDDDRLSAAGHGAERRVYRHGRGGKGI